jgi:hypothetical protein
MGSTRSASEVLAFPLPVLILNNGRFLCNDATYAAVGCAIAQARVGHLSVATRPESAGPKISIVSIAIELRINYLNG